MKKLFVAVCALCLAFSAKAQETLSETVSSDATTTTQTSKSSTADAMIIEYDAIDDGWGISMGFHGSHIEFGIDYFIGDTNDYISDNSAYDIKLGGNYAYWLGKSFYIEGSIGLFYRHSEIKYKGSDKEKDSTFGFYASPRIGFRLAKNFGLTAAYHWDFNKFKTGSEYVADYFSVGILIGI